MKIRHETHPLNYIMKLRPQILLDPSWQRGPVWTRQRKALLVDSILRGFDVPMIYLLERDDSLSHRYEVVDGQQRLRAIWEFIDGGYALSRQLPDIENVEISNKTHEELPSRFKSRIKDFEVVVGYITEARQPQVSEVFSRMQMSVRLNPPELRNAIQSGLRHAIDGVAREHPFFGNSQIPLARFKRQDYLAHAISVSHHCATQDAKAVQLKSDYENLTDSSIYSSLMAVALDILDILDKVNLQVSRRIKQKWMFVDLFYFLYRNRGRLNSIAHNRFAELYLEFDRKRLKFNREPERLLQGNPVEADKALYEYIMAFNYAGAEKANNQRRAEVIANKFAIPLGL